MARKKIGEILIDAGVIDEGRVKAALAEQQRWGGPLGRILVDMRLITEDVLVVALSQQLNFPTVDLDRVQVPPDVLELVNGEFAEQNGIVPLKVTGKFLDVAMTDPTNLGIVDELRIRTQLNIRPYIAGPKAVERAIARFYRRGSGVFDPRVELAQRARALELDAGGTTGLGLGPAGRPSATPTPTPVPGRTSPAERDAEIRALQQRISKLEALVSRDEDVIRKLLGLLVDKGVASRDEILKRIS